ncbi:sel1 repeat family protein, partial [Pseudomonas sp. MH10]|nr:sel1 repeat family protein [Pseudomonas sp. MH10]
MYKMFVYLIKSIFTLFIVCNSAWAELTPEQEAARVKGVFLYNMDDGYTSKPFLEIAAGAGDGESQYYLAELIR